MTRLIYYIFVIFLYNAAAYKPIKASKLSKFSNTSEWFDTVSVCHESKMNIATILAFIPKLVFHSKSDQLLVAL